MNKILKKYTMENTLFSILQVCYIILIDLIVLDTKYSVIKKVANDFGWKMTDD